MVETTTKKFAYSTGGDFTLTGTDYVGYFNISNGSPYVGTTGTVSLCQNSTFRTDVYTGEFLFDRDLSEILELPNKIESIKFQPNEYVTAINLNSKLKLLNDNNIFLYSRGYILDGNSPTSTITLAVTGITDSLKYYNDFNGLSAFNFESAFAVNPYGLESVVSVDAAVNTEDNSFIIFAPTPTVLFAVTGNFTNSTVGVVLSTPYIGDKNNDKLAYKNITDITIDRATNTLFVADDGNDAIYKYSVDGYITVDPGLNQARFLLESLGSTDNKYGVKSPKYIVSTGSSVIVYNKGSKFFVEYDNTLNVKNAAKLISSRDILLGIGYSKFYKLLCVAYSRSGDTFVGFYSDLQLVEVMPLDLELGEGESLLRVVFSENDSNVVYFITTGFIYKRFLSKPNKTIGVFSDEQMLINNPSGNFTGGTVVASLSNLDIIFAGKQDRLLVMYEQNDTNTILRQDIIENYDINSINLVKDEYVQADYINKELFKVVSNLFKLKNQYLGRFNVEYIQPNQSLSYAQSLRSENYSYKGYTYLDNYNFLQVDNINDLYLHENERISVGAINRCLTRIYQLQLDMLEQSTQKNDTFVQYLTTDGTLIID